MASESHASRLSLEFNRTHSAALRPPPQKKKPAVPDMTPRAFSQKTLVKLPDRHGRAYACSRRLRATNPANPELKAIRLAPGPQNHRLDQSRERLKPEITE